VNKVVGDNIHGSVLSKKINGSEDGIELGSSVGQDCRFAIVYNYLGSKTNGGYLADPPELLARNFFDSLAKQHSPEIFDLYICSTNSPFPLELRDLSPLPIKESLCYRGRGWDVGAFKFMSKKLLSYDLVIFLNSQARFTLPEALLGMVKAWNQDPRGLLGYSTSFEVSSYVRTSAFAIPPDLLNDYPQKVNSRYDACVFEHSPKSLTAWVRSKGLPVRAVYSIGAIDLDKSRMPTGVFRSHNQELLLVSDRHTRIFDDADVRQRRELEDRANNLVPVEFRFRSGLVAWALRTRIYLLLANLLSGSAKYLTLGNLARKVTRGE
jgi:hypothetical protein